MAIIWDPERGNWSTTQSAEFYADHPENFTERERAEGHIHQAPGPHGEAGWVTVPAGGLTPDCEPHTFGRCACGRKG